MQSSAVEILCDEVASGNPEHVVLELVVNGATRDLLRHALVIEDAHLRSLSMSKVFWEPVAGFAMLSLMRLLRRFIRPELADVSVGPPPAPRIGRVIRPRSVRIRLFVLIEWLVVVSAQPFPVSASRQRLLPLRCESVHHATVAHGVTAQRRRQIRAVAVYHKRVGCGCSLQAVEPPNAQRPPLCVH